MSPLLVYPNVMLDVVVQAGDPVAITKESPLVNRGLA